MWKLNFFLLVAQNYPRALLLLWTNVQWTLLQERLFTTGYKSQKAPLFAPFLRFGGRFSIPSCFSCGTCSVCLFLGHCHCSPSRKDIWIYEAPQDMVCSLTPHISSALDGWNPVCMSSVYTSSDEEGRFQGTGSLVAWAKLSEVKNSSKLEQLSFLGAKCVTRRRANRSGRPLRWYLYKNALS